MVQLFRAAPQFFRQIGPTVSDELQIAEIQLVEKGATVSREFISAPEDVIGRLSFSHICEIEWIDDPLVRYFYEQECMRCTWSVRELRRQIGTNLHIRVGLSKDPEKCLSPYKNGSDCAQLQVREPYNTRICFACIQGIIIFAGINQQTMKKIFLLILTSLVLFACQKEDQQQEENGLGSVTQEYTCSKCGAKYSVTCKEPNIQTGYFNLTNFEEGDVIWTLITNPSWGGWTVTDESGQNVPHYEALSGYYMYFICTCGEKSKVFKKDEFKPQIFKP